MTTLTRLQTPFTATATAADVLAGVDLTGKLAVVTGGASGIGLETARALAAAGASVVLAVRDADAGERAAEAIIASTKNARVRIAALDLAVRPSVRDFIARWHEPIHMLVNNAGVMATPESRTPEGWELQFATNHFGHFALTRGLHPHLAAAGGARVVAVSSGAHLMSDVVFDDVHFTSRPYDPWLAYGQSKTANILFAVEASKRWAEDGITVNALHPGAINTALQRHVTLAELTSLRERYAGASYTFKTPEQGAATSVLLAASPLTDGVTGRYFVDCNEALPNVPGTITGVAPYALDADHAARLWELTTETLR